LPNPDPLTPADLAGRWTLAREISDGAGGLSARFDGSAILAPMDGGLSYDETGTLTLTAGGQFAATRRYLWQIDGAGVRVLFADGKPFHSFTPGQMADPADHLCGADRYRVRYDWSGWPCWRMEVSVTGPRKDYRTDSLYRRA
jgi:hypothetical protein